MAEKVYTELSEAQFALLKRMCDQRVYVILGPHNMQGDSEEMKTGHTKNTTLLLDLVKQGFMENVTHEFNEVLQKAREKGGRTFDAFVLTKTAIDMFTPPEGSVN